MTIPSHLQYTADHEWVQIDGETATIGITLHAANALGDVVFLDLPGVGTTLTAGAVCGEVESTKSVSDLFGPLDGEVLEVNQVVVNDPGTVNIDPYGAGWLLRLRVGEVTGLLSAEEYTAMVEAS